MTRGVGLLACVLGCACLAACGKKGPPLPPLVRLPVAPVDFKALRRGSVVNVEFAVPGANTDGSTPGDVSRVDVYAMTGPSTLTVDEIVGHGTKVGTVTVNVPADPDATEAEAAKAAKAAPPDGREQGAVVRFDDSLILEAAADESDVRSYLAVGFNRRGRRGAVSPKLMVPLVESPEAPGQPNVAWDEKAITVSWPVPDQEEGSALAYHLYEPGEIDARLTKEPLDTGHFADTRIEWGAERCYIVRAVSTVQGLTLESDASSKTCVTLEDSFSPAAPVNLTLIAGAGAMNLIWDPGSEADIAGYIVFRALGTDTRLSPITPAPVDAATYKDVVPPGTRVTYAVQAIDKAGNASQMSEPAVDIAR